MTPAFRSVALASALAAISCGAMAAPIGFESLWPADSDTATNPRPGPKPVGDVEGLRFSSAPGFGAWAYKAGMLTDKDVLPESWDTGALPAPTCDPNRGVCNLTSFIMNGPRDNLNGRIIELSLDPKFYGGRYIRAVNFDLFYNTGPNSPSGVVRVLNEDGTKVEEFRGFTGGDLSWKNVLLNVRDEDYTRIQFNFNNDRLGLDNFDFTLTAAVPPPPTGVPEPASYALVGLALLAAGAARRRKA